MVKQRSSKYIWYEENPSKKEVAMLSILIVILLTTIRIGIPVAVLLGIGEMIKRRSKIQGDLRGA